MKKKKIFVIIGEAGEYSDRCVWVVKGVSKESLAKEIVIKMEGKARLMESRFCYDYEGEDKLNKYEDSDIKIARKFVGDSNAVFDFYAPHYSYQSIILE